MIEVSNSDAACTKVRLCIIETAFYLKPSEMKRRLKDQRTWAALVRHDVITSLLRIVLNGSSSRVHTYDLQVDYFLTSGKNFLQQEQFGP